MKSIYYPMKLSPIAKTAIWGGTLLAERFGKGKLGSAIAESWELAVRPQGDISKVANGEYRGRQLDEIPAFHNLAENFPLLIKYLDAADDLSVQVHPSGAAALARGEAEKNELWYIVHAEVGARIVFGLKPSVAAGDLARYISDDTLISALNYQTVRAGEVYYIPAGMIHALGGGITVAEIQTNSNTTYRLFDYNRKQADGTLRRLHIADAVDNARVYSPDEINALQFAAQRTGGSDSSLLAATKDFTVRLLVGDNELAAPAGSAFTVLMCTRDHGQIITDDDAYPYSCGDTYIVPEQCGSFHVRGGTLLAILPSPAE